MDTVNREVIFSMDERKSITGFEVGDTCVVHYRMKNVYNWINDLA